MCVVCSISLQILMPILLAFAAKTGVALQPRAGDRFEDNAESPCINCSSSSNIYIYIYGDSLKHLAGVLRASFKTLEQAAMESQYI